MWKRNALFIVLLVAGVGAFVRSVFPSAEQPRARARVDTAKLRQPGFQSAVQQLNTALRDDWHDQGVEPSPRAGDLAIARRLSLALTGTIPSLEEIRLLEKRPETGRIAWWTEGLLNDRRYSDYVAERLARAYVGVGDGPFVIYRRNRFVTWLSDQLHAKAPYDVIARRLIASDGLWTNAPQTNFLTATAKQQTGNNPDPVVLAARVYRAFLGVRVDCAQCHDHPFDRWTQTDFHQLAAFFGKTETSFTGVREGHGAYKWEPQGADEAVLATPAVPFAPELLPAGSNDRRRLAAWVTHPKNQAFAKAAVNRVWALMFGRPLVEPIDNVPLTLDTPKPLEILADDFVAHGYDLRRLIHIIAASEVFQLDCIEADGLTDEQFERSLESWALFRMTRLRPEQVVGSLLQACSAQTIDSQTHVLFRVARAQQQAEFVRRYGDSGEDEFMPHGGSIPQRLLMLNGNLVRERTKSDLVSNAAAQIAVLAPDDRQAVRSAYLAILTRLPTPEEAELFESRLDESRGAARMRVMEDIYAKLLNVSEFSWNH